MKYIPRAIWSLKVYFDGNDISKNVYNTNKEFANNLQLIKQTICTCQKLETIILLHKATNDMIKIL